MSVAPAGVALTGNTPGPESKYRLAPNRNNQWPSRLQILIWRCDDEDCARKTFMEQLPALVARRGSITKRAVSWAIGQLRREHATVHGLARQLGTSWKTV